MQTAHILSTFLFLLISPAPPTAVDLNKIDRTLQHEPAYRSGAPRYCLLVFGPAAKTRVWLVQDGNVLHVWTRAPGQAQGTWRQVQAHYGGFFVGDVLEENGKTRHTRLHVRPGEYDYRLTVMIAGKEEQMAGWDRTGKLTYAARASEAPIIHFNGPLTLDLFREQRPLRSNSNVRLSVVVGTPGHGPGTFALFGVCSYPAHAWPTATVRYPSTVPTGQPVTADFTLRGD